MSAWKLYDFSLSSIARPAAHNPLTFWLRLDACAAMMTRVQERFASSGGGRGSTKSHSKHFHLKLLVPQSFMVRMLPGTDPKHS